MAYRYWPLFDLVVTTEQLRLRLMREEDLSAVAHALPADLELDPSATRFAVDDEHVTRGIISHQQYWAAMGSWTPQSWHLLFVVHHEGRLVGCQALRAQDFPRLRTVDTWSYLHAGVRGRGLGKQARRAVLTLAFDDLGAKAATSSAWQDNMASRRVSAALGYEPNGEQFHRRDDGTGVMSYARLSRASWQRAGHAAGVTVTGVRECLPFFGLDGQRLPLR
jgi:RimJ/RimL family protein N-acetyltransferase